MKLVENTQNLKMNMQMNDESICRIDYFIAANANQLNLRCN